jgi:hypothetical protein
MDSVVEKMFFALGKKSTGRNGRLKRAELRKYLAIES